MCLSCYVVISLLLALEHEPNFVMRKVGVRTQPSKWIVSREGRPPNDTIRESKKADRDKRGW